MPGIRGFTHRSASRFGSIFFSRLIHSNIKSKQSQFTLPVFSVRHLRDKLWLFFQLTSRGQSNQITVFRFLPGLWVSINIWYVFTSLKAFDLRAGSLCCTGMMPLHCEIRCPSVTADLKLTLPWPTFPVRLHQTLKPPTPKWIKMTPWHPLVLANHYSAKLGQSMNSSVTAFHTFILQLIHCMATFNCTFQTLAYNCYITVVWQMLRQSRETQRGMLVIFINQITQCWEVR